ncbi:MAG: hypothetical protein QMC74_19270 [Myxococcota bacterium]|jgi:hypothetical protein
MMTSQLSLWQELLLLGTGLLSLVYVFYFRIWLALAISSDVLFAMSVALVVATIATPSLFDGIAHAVVERSPLPSALEDADARVAAFAALPGEMIDAALAKVGFEPDPEVATDSQELDGGPMEPGPIVSTLRPPVESLIAVTIRVSTFIGSGFLLLLSLATRASTTTARRLHTLAARVDELEAHAGSGSAITTPVAIVDTHTAAQTTSPASSAPGSPPHQES